MDEDDELLQIKVVQVGEISEKEEMFENPLDHEIYENIELENRIISGDENLIGQIQVVNYEENDKNEEKKQNNDYENQNKIENEKENNKDAEEFDEKYFVNKDNDHEKNNIEFINKNLIQEENKEQNPLNEENKESSEVPQNYEEIKFQNLNLIQGESENEKKIENNDHNHRRNIQVDRQKSDSPMDEINNLAMKHYNNSGNYEEYKKPTVNAASDNYGRYYIVDSQKKKFMGFDENKPYAKIKIIKSNMEGEREFIITPEGVCKSEKNTTNRDIMIGRQQSTAEGIVPNDIVLSTNDRAISRIHCKITAENFYPSKTISLRNLTILMMTDKKLGKNSPGKTMLPHLIRIIFSFLKAPSSFHIVDLGSVYGTYLKLKAKEVFKILKGQMFLIGSDTLFMIKEKICANTQEYKEIQNNENEELFRYLASEKKNNATIHGLNETEENILYKYFNESTEKGINETQDLSKILNRPLLKIELPTLGRLVSNTHIFVGRVGQDSDFLVGRSAESTVTLHLNTISRKQCKIFYFGGEWLIIDGDMIRNGVNGETIYKESANGTWISLVDYRMKNDRQESDPKLLEDESEIKISDTILKFEYPKKPQKYIVKKQ